MKEVKKMAAHAKDCIEKIEDQIIFLNSNDI